jgi:aspartyl-tRNA(Asn)/glutamyl-tRNA(Gln) amidotransferase subunit C
MIDRKQVLHVARLARLNLTEEEVGHFTGQLGAVLSYVEQLEDAPTGGIDPTCVMAPGHDSLRDDNPVPSLPREEILKNGPSIKQNHFAVPRVIG